MKKAVIDEIIKPVDAEKTAERERNVREKFWDKLKKTAKKVPYVEEVVACYYCALDPETPFQVRGTILAALAYFILPIDLVPDFILGFGLTDDIAVLTLVMRKMQDHITQDHRDAAHEALQSDEFDV